MDNWRPLDAEPGRVVGGAVAEGPGPAHDLAALCDRATLERWVRARTMPQRVVLRSRVVLLLAEGRSAREVARRLGVSRHTADLWRNRYLAGGCATLLHDRPGRGRKRSA